MLTRRLYVPRNNGDVYEYFLNPNSTILGINETDGFIIILEEDFKKYNKKEEKERYIFKAVRSNQGTLKNIKYNFIGFYKDLVVFRVYKVYADEKINKE